MPYTHAVSHSMATVQSNVDIYTPILMMRHSDINSTLNSSYLVPLLLAGGFLEYLLYATGLHVEEFGILRRLHGPSRFEARRVLIHQMSVLGATAPAKVLDLQT